MKRIMIDVGTEFLHQKMRYKIIRKSYTPDQESECIYTALAEAFNVEREFSSDEILELLNAMDSSRLILLSKNDKTENVNSEINDYDSMTEKEKEAAEKRLMCISPLLDKESEEKSFPKRVAQRVAELKGQGIKTSKSRLYLWIKEYVESEGDIRSLIDDNSKKGPQERKICEEVRNVITDVLKKYYLVKESRSISTIHMLIESQLHHRNAAKRANGETELKLPSKRTLYRVISEICKYEVAKKQYGKLYVQTEMGYFGVMEKPTRPLELVQMDSTPIDVILVDDETRNPLPRAHLTIAIDVKTRYVVGVNIGMGSPGYVTTLLTLRKCNLQKEYKRKISPFEK
jgi:putative transposase